jgi:tetratricopeptide (TPR) repeat protein
MNRFFVRVLMTGVLALGISGMAAPAFAQNGTLKGKVVTEGGTAAASVEVVLELTGDTPRTIRTITDKFGEWIRPGIPVGGTWKITAKKDKDLGEATIVVKSGDNKVPDIVLMTPESRASGKKMVSESEAAKVNKHAEEVKALTTEVNAAVDAGRFDEALAKLKTLDEKLEKCVPCQMKMAEVLVKMKNEAAAEAALLKGVEYDPANPEPYQLLANLYNNQKKFDEASKASAKANELMAATGGGGDATSLLNQGIIFWNAGKYPEAKAEFAKAVKVDPKKADAQYWLGLSTYNLAASGSGNLADAKGPLSEYLKLEPKGEYAEVAKALLATIK